MCGSLDLPQHSESPLSVFTEMRHSLVRELNISEVSISLSFTFESGDVMVRAGAAGTDEKASRRLVQFERASTAALRFVCGEVEGAGAVKGICQPHLDQGTKLNYKQSHVTNLLIDDADVSDVDISWTTRATVELFVREIEAVTGHRLDAAESARWFRELNDLAIPGGLSVGRYAIDAYFRQRVDEQLGRGQAQAYAEALRDYLDVAARLLLAEEGGTTWFDTQGAFATYFELSKSISTHSDEAEKLCHRIIGDLFRKVLTKHKPAAPDLTQLMGLVSAFPNLEEPISFIGEHLAMRKASGDEGFAMPPILLAGPPGIGKTYLSYELSRIIDAFPRTINMATVTHGFVLSGTDRKWGQAAPGAVVKAMMDSGRQTPIIVLDEIDKAGGFQNVLGPLYTLLDPAMATRFVDEFLGFEIDTSSISWIATANEKNHIPEPLLDRFQCFDIPPPSKAQLDTIVNNMYRGMAGRIHYLPEEIPAAWLKHLEGASLREVGRELQRAIGRVALARELDTGADIDLASTTVMPAKRRKMGF